MRYINFGDEPTISPDDFFMNEAIKEAKAALAEDEIPIGAIVVCKGKIIDRCRKLFRRQIFAGMCALRYYGALRNVRGRIILVPA
jgi:pyrimidine deaminase RibD-like protein